MRITALAVIAVTLLASGLATQAKQAKATDSLTFKLDTGIKIHVADNRSAKVTDLKVGDKVGIAYHDDQGTLKADKIHVIDKSKKKDAAKKGEKTKDAKKSKSDTRLHARGYITAVDAATGTVTADVQPTHQKSQPGEKQPQPVPAD